MMVSKLEGASQLVPYQLLYEAKQLETSQKGTQVFYLFRSGAEIGQGGSVGHSLDQKACSSNPNPIPGWMQAYVERLEISTESQFYIIASTATRALETAQYFIDAFKIRLGDEQFKKCFTVLLPTELLLERSVGQQQGQRRSGPEYDAKVAKWKTLSAAEKFVTPEMEEGYESFAQTAARIEQLLNALVQKHPKGTFFVFTHVHPIEAIVIHLLKINLDEKPGTYMPLEHLNPLEALKVVYHSDEQTWTPNLRLLAKEIQTG